MEANEIILNEILRKAKLLDFDEKCLIHLIVSVYSRSFAVFSLDLLRYCSNAPVRESYRCGGYSGN